MPPTISVIAPVRNEALSIERTLRLLLTQDFPREAFEVIVADGASTDETVLKVRRLQSEFPNLKLVFNPGRLSSAGRNTAIRHSTKDVAVIVDGHCHLPDANYLKDLSSAFETSGADCLGRPQPLDIANPTPFQQAVSVARSSRLGHNPGSDIYSSQAKFVAPQSTAIAYSRAVFHRVGLFDEAFDACEDVEFNERVHAAALTCYFSPKVKIVYEPRNGFRSLFYQLSRYGRGRARLAFKHPASLSIPALIPPLWVLWVVLGGFLSLFVPYMGWLWLASTGFYLSVLVMAGILLGRNQPLAVGTRIPPVFMAIHCGFAWGFWKEVLQQVRSRMRAAFLSITLPSRRSQRRILSKKRWSPRQ